MHILQYQRLRNHNFPFYRIWPWAGKTILRIVPLRIPLLTWAESTVAIAMRFSWKWAAICLHGPKQSGRTICLRGPKRLGQTMRWSASKRLSRTICWRGPKRLGRTIRDPKDPLNASLTIHIIAHSTLDSVLRIIIYVGVRFVFDVSSYSSGYLVLQLNLKISCLLVNKTTFSKVKNVNIQPHVHRHITDNQCDIFTPFALAISSLLRTPRHLLCPNASPMLSFGFCSLASSSLKPEESRWA